MDRRDKLIKELENKVTLLENNVYQLREQVQNAYKRIGELTTPKETTPIDRNYRGFSKRHDKIKTSDI